MFDALQRREAELARHRQNRGGPASIYANFTTQGQGTIEFEDPVVFGATFIEKPWPAYGSYADTDAARDLLGLGHRADCPLPQATGYVTAWDTNDRGHYVGCWVAVSVLFPTDIPVDAELEIQHFFTFTARALKDIPLDFRD